MPEAAATEGVPKKPDPATSPSAEQDAPGSLDATLPGHGSPAGEPLPTDRSSTTTGPAPSAVQDWQKAAAGRTATNPTVQQGVGPSSRDTPPPSGEAQHAKPRGDEATAAQAPAEKRPPRPTAATAKPAPAAATGKPAPAKAASPPPEAVAAPTKQHHPATPDNEALVEAITKRLAENLARALRQSVVEAVQGTGAPATQGSDSPADAKTTGQEPTSQQEQAPATQ